MAHLAPRTDLATHEVTNQPGARGDVDLWETDIVLQSAIAREGAEAHAPALAAYGQALGTAAVREEGRDANAFPPQLQQFDQAGRRIDEVRFHPAYHAMMTRGAAAGYSAIAWEEAPGGHGAHAAMVYLQSQVEPGTCCPLTMTYAAVPALAVDEAVAANWRPRVLSRAYDGASRPAAEKTGATIGMAMTEKQGGSDVRANSTTAVPDGAGYRLTGHKWFCSAPMSDAFLTLAYAPEGLTCFLVPRWTPDGARNAIHLMRLKEKLGNRSNASSEIEYHGAWAERLGEEGAGVRTIVEMVHHTRLDTAIAPAGLMRAAVAEAAWWCRNRSAFQRRLIDQPLMTAVLADLALDVEAATTLGLRVARAFDESAADPQARAFARLAVALAKYLSNKRCPVVTYEAMECLGGAGYVEESPMPLLYREAPLNSIWEGSGNVICLDVLRTLGREPEALPALVEELESARGADRRYDAALDAALARFKAPPREEDARQVVETLALLLQSALLLRHAPESVADAFVHTRLAGDRSLTTGAQPLADGTAAEIVARI
ncbi:MAG: acyl-CoA dehydrogenase family protein [Pseudomonadota bacterium]